MDPDGRESRIQSTRDYVFWPTWIKYKILRRVIFGDILNYIFTYLVYLLPPIESVHNRIIEHLICNELRLGKIITVNKNPKYGNDDFCWDDRYPQTTKLYIIDKILVGIVDSGYRFFLKDITSQIAADYKLIKFSHHVEVIM